MLNNSLPKPIANRDNIFEMIQKWDPSAFLKTEDPKLLSVESLIDIPKNLFIPIGPILTTTSLNFSLTSAAGKPYTLSIPIGNDEEIRIKAQSLMDKYNSITPKGAFIGQYHRWNLIHIKNIHILEEIIKDPIKLAEYKDNLDKIPNKFVNEEGYINVPSKEELPNNICKAKTFGLPYSVVSKLNEAGVTEINYNMNLINLVYTKQAVAGTYAAEVSKERSPITPEILKLLVVPSFSDYEEVQSSSEFKAAIMNILNMIEEGRSPVRFNTNVNKTNTSSESNNTNTTSSTSTFGTVVNDTEETIETVSGFL